MIIGLTGRVGSGKTHIASILITKLKLNHLDLDKIGHRLLEKKSVQKKLEATFNTSDRTALSTLVFSSPQKLKALNAIMHPLIKKEVLKKITPKKNWLISGALIQEIGLKKYCNLLCVVDASDETIIERISTKFTKIAPHQKSRAEFIAIADIVISNENKL
jgi:dephospho-CoA kinase